MQMLGSFLGRGVILRFVRQQGRVYHHNHHWGRVHYRRQWDSVCYRHDCPLWPILIANNRLVPLSLELFRLSGRLLLVRRLNNPSSKRNTNNDPNCRSHLSVTPHRESEIDDILRCHRCHRSRSVTKPISGSFSTRNGSHSVEIYFVRARASSIASRVNP